MGLQGNTTINGTVDNANAVLTGANSVLKFGNDTFANASLTVNEGTIDLTDDTINQTNIGTLTSTNGINLNIDIDAQDFENVIADTLNLGENSEGVVTVSGINLVNNTNPSSEFEVKIINTDSSNVTLTVADEISGTTYQNLGTNTKNYLVLNHDGTVELSDVEDTVYTSDIYEKWTQTGTLKGNIEISNRDGYSLALKINDTDWDESTREVAGTIDPLVNLNHKVTINERNLNFVKGYETYTSTEDMGPTLGAGVTNINGIEGAVLDFNGKHGFVLDNSDTLNLYDVTLTGNDVLATVEDEHAKIGIHNSTLDGNIKTTTAYALNISGNTTLNGSVGTANAVINDGTNLTLHSNNNFAQSDVIVGNNVNFNFANNAVQTQLANSFAVNGNITMSVDADLANRVMDRLPANTTVASGATIGVNGINLLSDATNQITKIPFAYDSFKSNVRYSGSPELYIPTQLTTAYAPIYKYGVIYDPTDGAFEFRRGGNKPSYEEVNPEIMDEPVAAEIGGYMTVLNNYYEAFRTMDAFMFLNKAERMAYKHKNKYASVGTPFIQNKDKSKNVIYESDAVWMKPYTVFEKVELKNGPDVSSTSYGSFFGFDSEIVPLKRGWEGMWGVYGSYNGSHQIYDGVSIYQNGGTGGVTGVAYKDNFFTGLTICAGANAVDASTMYGKDNFAMLMAGIASKTGYNFELSNGKFIIQPNLILSYSFINTFDYTNAAGIKIESDPLHAIQIEPGIKFIGHLKNGWMPYASVSVIWNILDETKVRANDISLPSVSVEPYVKYGVGAQKTWNDKLTGFLQTYVTNGGRNGVGIQFGLRWNLGKQK